MAELETRVSRLGLENRPNPSLLSNPGPGSDQSLHLARRVPTLLSDLGQVTFSQLLRQFRPLILCGFFPPLLRIPAPDTAQTSAIPAKCHGIKGFPGGTDRTSAPSPLCEAPNTTRGGAAEMPNLGTELSLPGGGEAFVCNAGEGSSVPSGRKPPTPTQPAFCPAVHGSKLRCPGERLQSLIHLIHHSPKAAHPSPGTALGGPNGLAPPNGHCPPPVPVSISGDNCHVRARGERLVPALRRQRPGAQSPYTAPCPGSPQATHPIAWPALRAGAGAGAGGGVFVPAARAQRRRQWVRAPFTSPA